MPTKSYSADFAKLKAMMQQKEIDFSLIQTAFLDMRDNHAQLRKDMVPSTKPLPVALHAALESALKQKGRSMNLLHHIISEKLPELQFMSGGAIYGNLEAAVGWLYFSDLKMGLLSVGSMTTGITNYCRLTIGQFQPEDN
jgi:hypothetical protein